MLTSLGVRVVTASNGKEALALFPHSATSCARNAQLTPGSPASSSSLAFLSSPSSSSSDSPTCALPMVAPSSCSPRTNDDIQCIFLDLEMVSQHRLCTILISSPSSSFPCSCFLCFSLVVCLAFIFFFDLVSACDGRVYLCWSFASRRLHSSHLRPFCKSLFTSPRSLRLSRVHRLSLEAGAIFWAAFDFGSFHHAHNASSHPSSSFVFLKSSLHLSIIDTALILSALVFLRFSLTLLCFSLRFSNSFCLSRPIIDKHPQVCVFSTFSLFIVHLLIPSSARFRSWTFLAFRLRSLCWPQFVSPHDQESKRNDSLCALWLSIFRLDFLVICLCFLFDPVVCPLLIWFLSVRCEYSYLFAFFIVFTFAFSFVVGFLMTNVFFSLRDDKSDCFPICFLFFSFLFFSFHVLSLCEFSLFLSPLTSLREEEDKKEGNNRGRNTRMRITETKKEGKKERWMAWRREGRRRRSTSLTESRKRRKGGRRPKRKERKNSKKDEMMGMKMMKKWGEGGNRRTTKKKNVDWVIFHSAHRLRALIDACTICSSSLAKKSMWRAGKSRAGRREVRKRGEEREKEKERNKEDEEEEEQED